MSEEQTLDALKDIRAMMERSSRFISLSGWSGVAAGICALSGAAVAYPYVMGDYQNFVPSDYETAQMVNHHSVAGIISHPLFLIAACTFIAAFITAFIFTYIKSQKEGIPIWGKTSARLLVNGIIPLTTGGLFIIRLVQMGYFGLIAPACLIFYGLSLLNASKYTYREIRWLGIAQLILGLLNCWNIGYGFYFWTIGFGVMHIVYGAIMWWKYDRNN